MLTIVQKGYGPTRLLVVAYFIANNHALLKNLPSTACVLTDNDSHGGRFAHVQGNGGVDSMAAALDLAHRGAGVFDVEAIVLIGWSAGAQAVREQLRAGTLPEVVICLDGASGSVPPTADQLAPWKAASEAARRGELLFILTTTQLTYTRTLPPADRFEATVYVATELWERSRPLSPAELLPPGAYRDGSFLVEIHASGTMDAEAHRREQNEHLPDLLGRVVMPWLENRVPSTLPTGAAADLSPAQASPVVDRSAKTLQAKLNERGASPELDVDGDIGPKTRAATKAFQLAHGLPATGVADEATWAALGTSDAPAGQDTPAGGGQSVGLLALERLRGELGVHETPGPGFTPRVVEYGGGAMRGRKHLDLGQTDEPAWCCALQGWAERDLPGALPWRWAVSERWADAEKLGLTRPKTYRARAGDEAIFARSGGDPRHGGAGHDTRLERDVDDAGRYTTIGGNEGGAAHHGGEVLLTERNVDDPTLVGFIVRT